MDKEHGVKMKPEEPSGRLTHRERFRRVMHFQTVDYIPHIEFGYWDTLMDTWFKEGHLPESFRDNDGKIYHLRDAEGNISHKIVEIYFGCSQISLHVPKIGDGPWTKSKVVEEKGNKRILLNSADVLYEEITEGDRSIPHFLEFPIKDRKSWESFRDKLLKVDDAWREIPPQEFNKMAREYRESDLPLALYFGSFVGWLRDWMGFEKFAFLTVDDPGLLEDMVAHLVKISLPRLSEFLKHIEYDLGWGWEDICFNSGPIINPRTFRSVVFPYMKSVIQLLRQHGIDIIWTDCDGNVTALVPIWLEAGINCLFPAEVKAGNDIFQLRKEYGKNLLIRGGFDKLVLLESKEAILKELNRLEPLLEEGGFIPHLDHLCPGGVHFKMYQYYIWEKCHMLGMPEEEIRNIPALQRFRL